MQIKRFLFLSILSASLVLNFIKADDDSNDVTEDFPTDNDVYVLTDLNFEKFFEHHKTVLVEFYAPWCGHCKQLAPEYEKAAKALKSKKSSVALAKVDATKETGLGGKYEVKGYPTMKFFKDGLDGQMTDYDGPRDADGLVNWLQEKTDPNYKPPPEAVLTLTKENFTSVALGAEIILVEFYAPWCGHCKQLAPEYEKAAKRLKNLDKPIPLAKVDATGDKELASDFQVTGYPTLKLLRKGRRFEYTGPRDADGIFRYMQEQAKPATKELKSLKEAQRALSQEDVTIIGFFDKSDTKAVENFQEACEALREEFKSFAYTYDKEIAEHFKASFGQIGIYYPEKYWSKFEPKFKFFDKPDASREDIVKFLLENCIPLVGQRTQANQSKRYTHRPLVVAYYTVDFGHQHKDGTQFWRQKILNVAQDYPVYRFAISDEDEFATEMKDLGLADSGMDVNVVVFGKDNRRYIMNPDDFDEFTESTFRKFMKKLNEGKISAYVKSQPLPKDEKGPVKVLVSANFDKIANDETKDVFIEFYAPWCGHCKALEPVYKQLAEKLKSEKHLVVAKFDATANDSPEHFPVEGFPTIYFAPSGRKNNPIKYTGGRTLEEMEKFLKENAVMAFKKTEL